MNKEKNELSFEDAVKSLEEGEYKSTLEYVLAKTDYAKKYPEILRESHKNTNKDSKIICGKFAPCNDRSNSMFQVVLDNGTANSGILVDEYGTLRDVVIGMALSTADEIVANTDYTDENGEEQNKLLDMVNSKQEKGYPVSLHNDGSVVNFVDVVASYVDSARRCVKLQEENSASDNLAENDLGQ